MNGILNRISGAHGWLLHYEILLFREQQHGPPRRGFVRMVRYWRARTKELKEELAQALRAERPVWALEP